MGYLLSARCPCGFQAEVAVGAGRMDHRSRCDFPALCQRCGQLVTVDLLAPPLPCPACGAEAPRPYDHPSLSEGPSRHTVARWSVGREERQLTDARHRCPGCRGMALRFQVEMLFD